MFANVGDINWDGCRTASMLNPVLRLIGFYGKSSSKVQEVGSIVGNAANGAVVIECPPLYRVGSLMNLASLLTCPRHIGAQCHDVHCSFCENKAALRRIHEH